MSYAITTKSISNVEPYLAQLVTLTPGEGMEFISTTASKLAYQLRQGIAAAHGLKVDPYAQLNDRFVFKVVANKVVCQANELAEYDKKMAITIRTNVNCPEITSLLELLPILVDNKDAKEITFPNYNPSEEDRIKLVKLCISYNMSVTMKDNILTLERV